MILSQPLITRILGPILILGPALTCVSPPIMATLFIACSVLGLGAYSVKNRRFPALDRKFALLFGGFLTLGILSTLWSINSEETPGKALQLLAIFAPLVCFVPFISALDTKQLRSLGYCTALGIVAAVLVYFIEIFSGHALWDFVRGGESNDPVAFMRNKPAVLLAFWAYLACPFFFLRGPVMWKVSYGVGLALVGLVSYLADSESAQMLLAGAPLLAGVIWLLPARLSLILTLAITIFITATMPFTARIMYAHAPWEAKEGRAAGSLLSRIEIWNQAANRTLEKPVFGWGLDSASELPNRNDVSILIPGARISHLHPHNAPIQIWFELGAAGIAFVIALFALLARRISNLTSHTAQKYAVFLWAMTFLYTLSIWGIWQSWFVATLCFTGLVGSAGIRYLDLTEKEGRP